ADDRLAVDVVVERPQRLGQEERQETALAQQAVLAVRNRWLTGSTATTCVIRSPFFDLLVLCHATSARIRGSVAGRCNGATAGRSALGWPLLPSDRPPTDVSAVELAVPVDPLDQFVRI